MQATAKEKDNLTEAIKLIFEMLESSGKEQFERLCLQYQLITRCKKCHYNMQPKDVECLVCEEHARQLHERAKQIKREGAKSDDH